MEFHALLIDTAGTACCCGPGPGDTCPSPATLQEFCDVPFTISVSGVEAVWPGFAVWPSGCSLTAPFTGTRWDSGYIDVCPVDGQPPQTQGRSRFRVDLRCVGLGAFGGPPFVWFVGGGWTNFGIFGHQVIVGVGGQIPVGDAPTVCPPSGSYPLGGPGGGYFSFGDNGNIILGGSPTITVG